MNPKIQDPPTSSPLIILFVFIMMSAVVGGIIYYKYQEENLLNEKIKELSAVTDLKIKQVTQWRFERLADARFIGENMMLARTIPGVSEKSNNGNSVRLILQIMKSLTENYDYRSAALLENNGAIKVAFPSKDSMKFDYPLTLLNELARYRRVILKDSYNNLTGTVDLDVVVPLTGNSPSDSVSLGFLVLRIDPSKVLYPMLKLWPEESRSSETIIVKKEGDDVIFLSELRFPSSVNRSSHGKILITKNIGSGTLADRYGTSDGIDYRGAKVVASMKKIPGTNWRMISKIDRAEVISGLGSRINLIFVVLLLFIITVGLFLGFLLWNQRVKFYREKYEDELHRLALYTHFDYILKFANDIILLIDNDLDVIESNDRAAEAYQKDRRELHGKNLSCIQSDETLSEIKMQLQEVYDNGSATFETVHVRKDNTRFPVEVSARLVSIEGKSYIQLIGRDITERKASEESLRESEQRFRKIFEESPFPMVITAKDFGIVRANEAFCTMTGYTEEDLKLHTLSELSHPEDAKDDQLNLMKLISGDKLVYQAEKRYLRSDGSVILGASTISVVRNNRDEVQLFIGMIEDITSKKKAELELVAAKLKAEESDRLKTAFLHNVSHEIRTPMNAIIGFSSLLNEPDITQPDRHQYTEIIFQSSNQLLSIINDIVDVANIESGLVTVNTMRIELNQSLKSLCDQFRIAGSAHGIPVSVSLGLPDNEAVVNTDSTKLIQIISNLINNSLKFTESGTVDFGYSLKENKLEFFVHDTGIGIPEMSIPKIFDRFYQVDRTVSRQFGGTGLGLSICKAYVQLLGGEISVSSIQGKGTSFYFTIPYISAS